MIVKGAVGLGGVGLSAIANAKLGGTAETVRLWLPWSIGILVSLAMLISISLDVLKKWKHRKE